MGVIHRDLKASNLLLNRDVDASGQLLATKRVLISDFGTCVIVSKVAAHTRYHPFYSLGVLVSVAKKMANRTGHTGTPEWVAPELIDLETGTAGELNRATIRRTSLISSPFFGIIMCFLTRQLFQEATISNVTCGVSASVCIFWRTSACLGLHLAPTNPTSIVFDPLSPPYLI